MASKNKFNLLLDDSDDESIISEKRDRASTADIDSSDSNRKSTLTISSDPCLTSIAYDGVPDFYDRDTDFTTTDYSSFSPAPAAPTRKFEVLRDERKKVEPFSRSNDSIPFTRKMWCRYGNACMWKNCPFRHEICSHFASGRCRAVKTDPESNKPVCEGGCQYDHRDHSKLREYVSHVEIRSEEDLLDKFPDLIELCGSMYDASKMDRFDRHLLVRSLRKANIDFINYHEEAEDDYTLRIELPSEQTLNTEYENFGEIPNKEFGEEVLESMRKDFPQVVFRIEEADGKLTISATWTKTN